VPRVSVVLATYNWSSVLRFSIRSALAQTFRDFELLVVGDGCTDDSADVVRACGDPRVHWINLPANSGHQSAPNNEGLRRATGDVIAYLGHDDLWLPHHLAVSVQALDRTGADLAHTLVACVGPDDAFVWPSIPNRKRQLFSPPSGMVHRRSVTDAIGGWRDYRELKVTPDVELWRRARDAGYRFTFAPRLTALKFPASWRKGVYRERPSHEQAAWLERMAHEPDLEAAELVKMVISERPSSVSYVGLIRFVLLETWRRARGPAALPWRRGALIDAVRSYKGL
jgi:glycosyltransferase involved in cell wall biosynthesis